MPLPYMRSILGFTLAVIAWTGNAHAAPGAIQPITELRATVEDYLKLQLPDSPGVRNEIAVNPIDSRLRLAACNAALEPFLPPGQRLDANVTVGVRCSQPAWSIYLPAQLHRYANVLIAKRPFTANEVLSAADVEIKQADLAALSRGYFLPDNSLTGYVARRPIQAGAVLHAGMLSPPMLVKRGDRVAIVAASGGLEIRVFGVALADGVQGGRIAVRNASSNRIVQTIVTQPGTVEVRL